MEEKDEELLTRVTANHLFLAQFEAFRATLLTLRSRNPDLARTILQTIVSRGGRLDSVLWSHSCASPALLAFLSTLELLQFKDPTSAFWSFDPDTLKLRVEFLLHVHVITSLGSDGLRKGIDFEGIENGVKGVDNFDSQVDLLNENEDLRELSGDSGVCLRVLDRIYELGLSRLKPDLVVADEGETEGSSRGGVELEEAELMCLRNAILENADVFNVLCDNIHKQIQGDQHDDSGMAITLKTEGRRREEDDKVLRLIQRSVQITHLDAMKECLKESDEDGAISHIRFLHIDYGLEESEYWYV